MSKHPKPTSLDVHALSQLFYEARSYNAWLDHPVSDEQINKIWDLLKMAPTSANMQPIRIIWVKSEAKKRLLADCAMEANRDKINAAPVTAIIGYDINFHEELPWLFPHTDAKSWFEGDIEGRKEGAFRNCSLQGAYLILAARAIGLDCGPMSGFDAEAVNKAFFGNKPSHKVNFICSIGHGDPSSIFDRSPRPTFDKFNIIV